MPLSDFLQKFDHLRPTPGNGDRAGIHSERGFFQIMERERERANRSNNQFSLIVLDLEFPRADHPSLKRFLKKITQRIRIIDEIGWYGPKSIGIILPYTSAQNAQRFTANLNNTFDSSLPVAIGTVYTYPPEKAGSEISSE